MTQPNPPKPRVHFSMLRNYQLADLITLANGAAAARLPIIADATNLKRY